jgi:hypothetical protein
MMAVFLPLKARQRPVRQDVTGGQIAASVGDGAGGIHVLAEKPPGIAIQPVTNDLSIARRHISSNPFTATQEAISSYAQNILIVKGGTTEVPAMEADSNSHRYRHA